MATTGDPMTTTLQHLSSILTTMSPGNKKNKFEEEVKELNTRVENYKVENPHLFPDPAIKKPLSKSVKRVLYLKTMNLNNPAFEAGDIKNHAAVVDAYETGKLDIANKKPGDIALFWGGEMKRGWGDLDTDFETESPLWMQRKPQGKLWVEDGALENQFQY